MCRYGAEPEQKHRNYIAMSGENSLNAYNAAMNISKKLFLSFVGLTCITLIATLLLARWSFDQGFTEFIDNLEQQRLTRISTTLERLLLDADNKWDQIPPLLLEQVVNQEHSNRGPGTKHGDRPPRGPGGFGPPPPRSNKRPHDKPHQGPMKRRPPPPRPESPIYTVLYDLDGNKLAGKLSESGSSVQFENAIINEVVVTAEGETLGLLRSWNTDRFGSSSGGRFSQQQHMTSLWIGIFCIVLAGIISFYLSKGLVNPLNRALEGIQAVSKGHYGQVIKHQRNDELGTLMDNINALAFKLEKSKSAKNRWFADISHELRTPLSVLLGEVEAILVGIRPADEKNLKSLEQEALVLKRLIDDLYQLSVSDIGALRYELKSFDLSILVERLCESAQRLAEQASVTLTCDVEHKIFFEGDENRLSQLISNLINNSIKYTDSSGTSHLSLTKSQGEIRFEIEDSSPSVSEDMFSQMFDPLFREEKSRNRDKGGAGLGLAICKNIVEAHGGTIEAQASLRGGVCVTVRLPTAATTV